MPPLPITEFGHWPPSKRRALTAHRNAGLEVVLIVRGELTWHVEGRIEAVPPGSVFFTWPWETHGSVRQREPGCELFFVVIRLDRLYVRPNRSFAFHRTLGLSRRTTTQVRQALLAAPRRSWLATARLASIVPDLVAEMARPDVSADAVHALARLVLIELERSVRGQATARPQPDAELRVQRFTQRLPDECHRPWTLTAMADACDLGRSRFSDLLKRLTGDSPKQALNRARIDRAQRLLATTDAPITRIALDCGFTSSQHFAAAFRAYTGCSARAYRTKSGHVR